MEIEPTHYEAGEALEHYTPGRDLSAFQVESLIRNSDRRNVVASLREAHAALAENEPRQSVEVGKRWKALALQEQWDNWVAERDQLRSEIRRGWECLDQVERELDLLHSRLEEWPAYERVCGRNPLLECIQAIAAQEHIQQFLPVWLKRREEQLQALTQRMSRWAKEHDVEHLV
jgi:hypothetical protein